MGSDWAGAQVSHSPSASTRYVSGSTVMVGVASFSFMSRLPNWRVLWTATFFFRSPSRAGTPAANAAAERNVTEVEWRAAMPNIGRYSTGWGVGIDAFGSPIAAQAIIPPFNTSSGLTPKNAGRHNTRSASLPTSIEPTTSEMPWAMAGLIVYLAR